MTPEDTAPVLDLTAPIGDQLAQLEELRPLLESVGIDVDERARALLDGDLEQRRRKRVREFERGRTTP